MTRLFAALLGRRVRRRSCRVALLRAAKLLVPIIPDRQPVLESLALALQDGQIGGTELLDHCGLLAPPLRFPRDRQEVDLEVQQLLVDRYPVRGVLQMFRLWILSGQEPFGIRRTAPVFSRLVR